MDDPDEAIEEAWCDEQRAIVVEYLVREGFHHGEVGDGPAWHVYPCVAIWAVESVENPSRVGWWAISGDLPTDYTPCGPERHPREGLRAIALRWRKGASLMGKGKMPENWSVGTPGNAAELAPLLASRAEILLEFAANDDLWEE